MSIVFLLGLLVFSSAIAQEATVEPTTESDRYQGEGFSLFVPPNATVEINEDGTTTITGPELSIRPTDQDFSVEGAAYQLTISTYENAEGLTSEEWATAQIFSDWQNAQASGQTTGSWPVTEQGQLNEEDIARLTVGGLDALQVDFFGGDSTIISIYVAHETHVLVFNYVENIVQNNPMALVQQDIYALMLDSLMFHESD
jgi:hypothetical protein